MVEVRAKVGAFGEVEVEVSDLEVGQDQDTGLEPRVFSGGDLGSGGRDPLRGRSRVLVVDSQAIINHRQVTVIRKERSKRLCMGSMENTCERSTRTVIRPSLLPIQEIVVRLENSGKRRDIEHLKLKEKPKEDRKGKKFQSPYRTRN